VESFNVKGNGTNSYHSASVLSLSGETCRLSAWPCVSLNARYFLNN